MSNKRLSKYWDYDIKNLGKVMHIFIEKIAMNKKYSHFFVKLFRLLFVAYCINSQSIITIY